MATGGFFIFSAIIFFLGIGLFILGFIWLKQKRLIENIPTSKIRSIAMGLVEIFGEVVSLKEHNMKSPFSQNDCVYYKYTVEEYRRSGKHSHWVTIKKGEERRHFYLKDETGSVLVDPKDAKIVIPMDNEFNSSFGRDPPDSVKQFLQAEDIRFEGFIFGINKTMRYREYFIAPRDKLYIMGTAADNPFVEEATAVKGVEDIMIQKGKNDKFYYISDKTERNILKEYTWKVVLGLGGGSIFIIIGLITFL